MPSESDTGSSDIIARREGRLGHLTLNRPKKLNSIGPSMAREMDRVLDAWRTDERVEAVLIDSSSPRAFCAGGDIRHLSEVRESRGPETTADEMSVAYGTMQRIAAFPKPVVTVMDGITMGGGIGLGAFGTVRVVTERSVLAMPEVMIGLTPDAGGSWLLARAPGRHGLRLAMTGGRMHGAEAVTMGFADVFLPSEKLPELAGMLADRVLAEVALLSRQDGPELAHDLEIAAVYADTDVEGIIRRLREADSDWMREDLKLLEEACPWSVGLSAWSWNRAKRYRSLPETIMEELKLVRACLRRPDFAEGVRARVIDKDNAPRWSPADIGSALAELRERGFS
ncbi:enoyl-CoA hydratase/isomerase family protein [Acetobacter sp. AN02]|uniref:enoyl-CoA hydratase/isomerase family protein n=1 Tax=Acetobacter sp. AN02 TaxID=2894186 RepID=UPI0024340EC1|nr:enoyl-CoA hydratase/isomerase family protein [Acetobacter sp. AN02]MDG6094939.1 enoyl-CoA hydratase/isomerase family protein [Acetobacter sp. AN02]